MIWGKSFCLFVCLLLLFYLFALGCVWVCCCSVVFLLVGGFFEVGGGKRGRVNWYLIRQLDGDI